MRLDLNFNENTHLREWWKQVYNNFYTLQETTSLMQSHLDNACTKSEAQQYIAELADSSSEIISALKQLSEALETDSSVAEQFAQMISGLAALGSSVSELESFTGKAMTVSEEDLNDAPTGTEFYAAGTANAPENTQGFLVCMSTDAGKLQIAMCTGENGLVYKRFFDMETNAWSAWTLAGKDGRQEKVVFGSYTGDDENTSGDCLTAVADNEREIVLGFTPRIVEVMLNDGRQFTAWSGDYFYYGGTAMTGLPCETTAGVLIEITDGGFKVHNGTGLNDRYNKANAGGEVYYYKAYE